MSSETIIDVKQAVAGAIAFVKRVYSKLDGLRLEEVEMSSDDRYWLVTLGFFEPAPESPMKKLLRPLPVPDEMERVYKIIKVDAKSGDAISMKIRKV